MSVIWSEILSRFGYGGRGGYVEGLFWCRLGLFLWGGCGVVLFF